MCRVRLCKAPSAREGAFSSPKFKKFSPTIQIPQKNSRNPQKNPKQNSQKPQKKFNLKHTKFQKIQAKIQQNQKIKKFSLKPQKSKYPPPTPSAREGAFLNPNPKFPKKIHAIHKKINAEPKFQKKFKNTQNSKKFKPKFNTKPQNSQKNSA